jgi:hypothetical protein
MVENKKVVNLTKEMLEDLYIIATVYKTTIEEVIKVFLGEEFDIEYVA